MKQEEDSSLMAIVEDPEGNETSALRAMIDFKNARVLEVGCGDGRLTWRYADKTAHVTAIDPDGEDIERAWATVPDTLRERVRFLQSTIEDFAGPLAEREYDIALFSWSL